jgi:hypothetical protein
MPQKFQQYLDEAIKRLQIADHMAYVTFPVLNDPRLILKILDEIIKSTTSLIQAVLDYEYYPKHSGRDNSFNIFLDDYAQVYGLTNTQIEKIMELFELNKKRNLSAMEFVRKDKIVILSDDLNTEALNIQKVKEYLLLSKEFLMKVNRKINP